MQRLDFIAVAKSDQAGLRADAFVESEDQGAIVAGGVVSAGGVAEMMIEAREAWAAAEKMKQAIESSGMWNALAARTCGFCGDGAIGQTNGAAVGKLEMIFQEAAVEGKAGDIGGILKAIEFFFLDGEENALFVEKRDGRTVTKGRDTKKVHVLFDQAAPCASTSADCGRDASKFLPSKPEIVTERNSIGRNERPECGH